MLLRLTDTANPQPHQVFSAFLNKVTRTLPRYPPMQRIKCV